MITAYRNNNKSSVGVVPGLQQKRCAASPIKNARHKYNEAKVFEIIPGQLLHLQNI